MSAHAHPSEETLVRYAAGTLPRGPRVVIDAHLAGCATCRALVGKFEAVGGAILAAQAPVALGSDALDRVFARIDAQARETGQQTPQALPRLTLRPVGSPPVPTPEGLPEGFVLPDALAGCEIAPLRPVAPGLRMARVKVPGDSASQVMLLRIEPGRAIPEHTHRGVEFTQVLSGTYRDHRGPYGPGDLIEADQSLMHTPVVDPSEECICIVAIEGALRFRGLLGVVLRPFV